jgi:uncharacterized protein (DUF1800 family)
MATQTAFIAANRFGMGAGPGELDYLSRDPKGALLQQLTDPITPSILDGLSTGAEAIRQAKQIEEQRKQLRLVSNGDTQGQSADMLKSMEQQLHGIYTDEASRRTLAAVISPTPFIERLVQFWGNHFTVSIQRGEVTPVAGAFEREAIRPNIMRRFVDMLRASTQHPAMLLYLDNVHSIGPNSRFALKHQHGNQHPGLNENLARELMELHTLGVGHYTQADVTAMARILTGWTIGGPRDQQFGSFRFQNEMHEPGPKNLLGTQFQPAGETEGEGALQLLASHPSTAQHIATKLAQHFIADEPPPRVVERLAAVFLRTGGDLDALTRALVDEPEAWAHPLAKAKDANDFVIASLRATGVTLDGPNQVVNALNFLGQRPFSAPSPAGWPDIADGWISSDSLVRRLQWALSLAGKTKSLDVRMLAEVTIGPVMTTETREAIQSQRDHGLQLAMLLGSREFQRR